MTALDPIAAPAGKSGQKPKDQVRQAIDVTEERKGQAELYGIVSLGESEWRRRLPHLALWLCAAAVSLLANFELFMIFADRPVADIVPGPADPAIVLVDLPSIEPVPSPEASPTSTKEAWQPPDALDANATAQTTSPTSPVSQAASNDLERVTVPPPIVPSAMMPLLEQRAQTPPPRDAAKDPPRPMRRPRLIRKAAGGAKPEMRKPTRHMALAPASSRPAPRLAGMNASASAFDGSAQSSRDWKSQVVAALNRAKRYPDGAGATGSPTIRMMVAASGDVAGIAVVASSGSSLLDNAAIETVRRTSPLPPPPGGATGLTFRMNFRQRTP